MEIDNIQALLNAGAAQAATDPLSVTEEPAILVPEHYELASLERFMDTPQRLRRLYRTHLLADYIRYVNEQAQLATQEKQVSAVFIRSDGSGAKALIDAGSHDAPHWGDHRAELVMKTTEAYNALSDACQSPLTQRDLTDYLEDWHEIIECRTGEKPVRLAQAVAAIRKVQVNANGEVVTEEGDWKKKRSAMESIEAKADANRPDTIIVKTPIYEGTSECHIEARLSLLTGHAEPLFRLRIMAAGMLQQQIRDEVQQRLRDEISSEDAAVYVGEV